MDDIFLMEMGKRIYNRRKELKLTQEQLAEAMDLSLQSVSCIELGKKGIRPQNLVKLCKVLNISADYILMSKRDSAQMTDISEKLSRLSDSDFEMVSSIITRLSK